MGHWIEEPLLTAVILVSLCIVQGQKTETLNVCEGSPANFSYNYNPEGYERVSYSFKDKTGKSLMYKIYSDEEVASVNKYYKDRFPSTPPTAVVGFNFKTVKSSDEGNYSCSVVYPNGSKIHFRWNLDVKDSTMLSEPKITRSSGSETNCKTYNCSHVKKAEVETYWVYRADEIWKGSTLTLCKENGSEIIACKIKSFCSGNFTYFNTTKDCPTRQKRSTSSASPGEASDDCDGDTGSAIEEDKQNTGMGAGIGIGFSIASVLALIAVLAMVYLYKRRNLYKRRKAAKDYNKDEIKENGIVMPLVHCIQEESRGDCKN